MIKGFQNHDFRGGNFDLMLKISFFSMSLKKPTNSVFSMVAANVHCHEFRISSSWQSLGDSRQLRHRRGGVKSELLLLWNAIWNDWSWTKSP